MKYIEFDTERLRSLMQEHGMISHNGARKDEPNARALARAAGINPATATAIVHGSRTNLRLGTVAAIAAAFNVPPYALIKQVDSIPEKA